MQFDEMPPFIFFWIINKLLRMFSSVKTDEGKLGNDGSASSLSQVT